MFSKEGEVARRRILTWADGGDGTGDIEAGDVRVRAGADSVKPAAEELPVDGVDSRVRNLHLDLAGAGGGNGDVLAHQLLDGVRGVALGAVRVGPPSLHHLCRIRGGL